MPQKTLKIAKHLVDKEKDNWTWSDEYVPAEKKLPCTVFCQRVLKERLGRKLTTTERQRINVVVPAQLFPQMVRNRDIRVAGPVAMIVLGGHGKEIPPGEAKPGDFVQFWINGKGHACIIHRLTPNGNGFYYISSNKSTNGPGVGAKAISFKERSNKKVWIARLD
jgi:hypothetical protein